MGIACSSWYETQVACVISRVNEARIAQCCLSEDFPHSPLLFLKISCCHYDDSFILFCLLWTLDVFMCIPPRSSLFFVFRSVTSYTYLESDSFRRQPFCGGRENACLLPSPFFPPSRVTHLLIQEVFIEWVLFIVVNTWSEATSRPLPFL